MTARAEREFAVRLDEELDTVEGGGAKAASEREDMAEPGRGMENPVADPYAEELDTEEAAGVTRKPGCPEGTVPGGSGGTGGGGGVWIARRIVAHLERVCERDDDASSLSGVLSWNVDCCLVIVPSFLLSMFGGVAMDV